MILKSSRALVGVDLSPVEPGTIEVADGRIASVRPTDTTADVTELDGVTLLPGFIDSHVHIGFFDPIAVLAGGVTAVRDLGWPPADIYPLARASRDPAFPGPSIDCVGPMLTAAGGYPTAAAWAPSGTGRVVASAADAAAVVAEQFAAGAAAIKVALNDAVGPTLDAATLAAICNAAHSHGLRVTAHIHSAAELAKAIEAGVDELAHVLMSSETIPEAVIAEMVLRDIAVVPTLSVFPERDLPAAIDNVARFAAAGGRVVYGTDLGNEGPRPGIDRLEVERMAAAGLDGRAIVASATTDAASRGFDNKGAIEVGFDADIVGVRGDPLEAPTDLCDVVFVMRGGRVVVG